MSEVESLLTTMIEPLIDHPEDFAIERVETDEFMEYHLHLNPDDIGRVIGRRGRVVRAIRTIVYSMRNYSKKRARIVIVDETND